MENNNNYYKYETPELVEPNNNEKYKGITNVSQLSNQYIKQPKSNEFIIKSQSDFLGLLIIFIASSIFSTVLICVLIFDRSGVESIVGMIIAIVFTGFLTCISFWVS